MELKDMSKDELLLCIEKVITEYGLSVNELEDYNKKSLSISKKDYKSVFPKNPEITKTGDKTYIKNLKILLAQNLYSDSKIIKLTDKLSKLLKIPDPPIGWYISEKWDGIRAIWDGEKFVSRGTKVFTYVPEYFIRLMPPGIALDGEIWIGRNMFKKTGSISNLKIGSSRTQKQIDDLWYGTNDEDGVKYKVYDLPNSTQPFENRMAFLKRIVEDRTKVWNSQGHKMKSPIQFTEQTLVKSYEQLYDTYNKLTKHGAEGIMLRAPHSPYEFKRSKYLLKYKIKEDAEAIVLDYMFGTGRLSKLLGSLKCELILNQEKTGIIFNIGTGFSDIQRTEYNDPKSIHYIPIGSIVSFSYMELSEDRVPRHPVYRGIRDDVIIGKSKEELENKIQEIDNKSIKQKILDNFNVLIKTTETSKEPNWQFKRKAYKQVVDILSASPEEINTVDKALEILRKGGAKYEGEEAYFKKNGEYKNKVIQKINTIINTGKLSQVEKYTEDPKIKAITELTKIPEIGPAAAEKLFSYGIETIAELVSAYKMDNSILNDKQVIGLNYYSDLEKRIPREEMNTWNTFFKNIFNEEVEKLQSKNSEKFKDKTINIELVGSYRRGAESSGDIDILISSNLNSTLSKTLMIDYIKSLMKTDKLSPELVFSSGTTKFMGLGKLEQYYRHIDIFYYSDKEYPFALLFSTGSAQFNVEMRTDAIKKGYSLSEKNLKHIKKGKGKSSEDITKEEYLAKIGKEYPTTEKDIFDFLGIEYVNPINRQSGAIKNKK
jgi:DNA polymerase/3'-5' exonuclease PolX